MEASAQDPDSLSIAADPGEVQGPQEARALSVQSVIGGTGRLAIPTPGGASAATASAAAAVAAWSGHEWVAVIVVLLPALLLGLVVCVAVLARTQPRRKAALDVLDRLIGRSI